MRNTKDTLVKSFKVSEQHYKLFFDSGEFSLYLLPDLKYITRNNREEDWLFWDEPVIDDVNQSIDVFKLLVEVKKYIVNYVFCNDITYFYFIASTTRKVSVYKRLAKHLSELLGYTTVNHLNGFYFWKQ